MVLGLLLVSLVGGCAVTPFTFVSLNTEEDEPVAESSESSSAPEQASPAPADSFAGNIRDKVVVTSPQPTTPKHRRRRLLKTCSQPTRLNREQGKLSFSCKKCCWKGVSSGEN
ncbi:MAG: hypothetical protein R3F37_00450 [Candidatus Competibacteraceae bacterium]